MKRIVAAMFSLVVVLGLFGCGSSDNADANKGPAAGDPTQNHSVNPPDSK